MTESRRRLAAHLRGHGIEIGALHLPLEVPPAAHVTYVDRLPVDELRKQYVELAEHELTRVDVLGNAEDLSAFAGASQDFVIANHLIEHLEDPVGGLREFHRVLKPGGLLFLCVPDARATFDRHRQLTTTEHLLAESRDRELVAANRHGHYVDWVENVLGKAEEQLGRPLRPGELEEHLDHLLAINYSIHFHCWNADTFRGFFAAACAEAGLRFEVLDWIDTVPFGNNELILLAAREPTIGQRVRISAWPRLKSRLRGSPAGPLLLWVRQVLRWARRSA